MSPPDAALTANSLSWPSTAVLWLTLSGISREIERLSSLTCYRATFCSAGGLSDGRNFVHCAKISSTFSHVVACKIQQLSENVGFICCLNLLTKSFLDSSKFLFCSWSSLNGTVTASLDLGTWSFRVTRYRPSSSLEVTVLFGLITRTCSPEPWKRSCLCLHY